MQENLHDVQNYSYDTSSRSVRVYDVYYKVFVSIACETTGIRTGYYAMDRPKWGSSTF